jgi:hypothetical protein
MGELISNTISIGSSQRLNRVSGSAPGVKTVKVPKLKVASATMTFGTIDLAKTGKCIAAPALIFTTILDLI